MVRENSDVPYYFSIKAIRKIKQLLAITFFYCEENHNLSLNQFVTHLNWLKSALNAQIFSFPSDCPITVWLTFPYIPLRRCTELYDVGHQNRCCPAILEIPKSYLAKK